MPCPQCNSKKIVKNGRTDWIWLAIDATTPEILGVYIGDRDRANQQSNCGIHFRQFTVNALFVTLIFGKLTNKYYRVSVTVRLVKRLVIQVILNRQVLLNLIQELA
jgi:hypothetical protein